MKQYLLLILALIVLQPALGAVCSVYFTYEFCENCEATDPIVLLNWTSEYHDLVIIEYFFNSWTNNNAQLLGYYSAKYGSIAAVPQLIINESMIAVGRLEVPQAENLINNLDDNPCLLLNQSINFIDLDLNSLPGEPKFWANNRVLIRLRSSSVSSDFLRSLLFTDDIPGTLSSSSYNITELTPQPIPLAYSEARFNKSFSINGDWLINFDYLTGNESQVPSFWDMNLTAISLPLLTVLIAGSDAFNPCAFFLLTFLLSALIYAKSRKRILLVGGIFVFFTGLTYFLFMSAWLNIFLIAKEVMILTIIAGLIAIIAGAVNIKDYFLWKKGPSLTLPKHSRTKFVNRVNSLIKSKSILVLAIGTAVLALTVNLYELLCTVGFPVVYVKALTMNNIPVTSYYIYLIIYNLIYVAPLMAIVLAFAMTFGAKKVGREGAKKLKLISGIMITLLGLTLLFSPSLLDNAMTALSILIISLIASGLIMLLRKKLKH